MTTTISPTGIFLNYDGNFSLKIAYNVICGLDSDTTNNHSLFDHV